MSKTREGQYDVFISYESKDKNIARTLASRCKQSGLRTWFDEWEIKPGDPWAERIFGAIENSRACVILISGSTGTEKPWVSREWTKIQERAWSEPEFAVVPVALGDRHELPPFLRQWHAVEDVEGEVGMSRVASYVKDCLVSGSTGRSDEHAQEDQEERLRRILDLWKAVLEERDQSQEETGG